MTVRVRVFLDTSALFAGIWSPEGGARMILRLAEAGAFQIILSSNVLSEMENNLRKKAPTALGALTLILDRAQVEICSSPDATALQNAHQFLEYPGDAMILAAAWESDVDYFVTLDRKHFLSNPGLIAAVPFPIGTPGDFLHWFKSKF